MTVDEVRALLQQKDRIDLSFYPTPLQKLERLSESLGVNLYIKREDFSGQSLFGGNKIRKLEYLLGDAKRQGAEYVFTYGATQSNHAMQTAEACRKAGLKPVLYLLAIVEPDEKELRGNLLLDRIFGAEIHIIRQEDGETEAEANDRMFALARQQMEELKRNGHACYDIPKGGASPIGTTGFIGGFAELTQQLTQQEIHADYLFHATGTGGTMAGLVAGRRLLNSDMKIISIDVTCHDESYVPAKTALGNEALAWLGAQQRLTEEDFCVDPGYYLPGYEQPNEGGTEAIRMMAEQEGILLDPVYSGKGFAGLVDYVRTGKALQGSNVVFLHTGGATALFAEREILGDLLL
ncbi:MAG: D-cysteine desulfhydrase family protein [Lachnospiraceae bacterium]|nr:D-cysteine desulfhydrase family protein [Lachnospiraceae bacterium]